jgi:hypothetical protein
MSKYGISKDLFREKAPLDKLKDKITDLGRLVSLSPNRNESHSVLNANSPYENHHYGFSNRADNLTLLEQKRAERQAKISKAYNSVNKINSKYSNNLAVKQEENHF